MELVEKALAGNRYALARLISLIEDNGTEARAALAALYPHTGQAHVVGVTGAPGTGKSTLVNELTKVLRAQGTTVGIVAVDPSSPFSGGALLGDRVRMRDLAGDQGVFIRSMATRGSLGGLARATSDVVKVLDAVGFSVVLVETVGAGQAEVDIARTAHTTVVVEAPGLGDEVQALKAGLLEIADVLVVNKADRPGAAQTARALEMVINRNAVRGGADDNAWRPPILKTIALDGSGVPEVLEAIVGHREYLRA
ncbi:MAG TPA: methylmalonyl Co-A mutase-associated GTPase MeaB, partial [Thermoflexia bacterium]|nr:methylmalonyl Co-A mutase-associated GTPase MeaB [Thermoflexia bacterium]